ncbi:putative FAD-linked oxidoreductase [bacterium BMS3Abin07]|nr:putative FAD-linked oxidoreductase [bacterium BMS3Abin07]
MLKKSTVGKFREILGGNNCWDSPEDVICYSYDAAYEEPVSPDIVVKPGNYDQIGKIIRLCAEENIPLVIRGAGTNLSGGTVPLSGGCVLLTSGLNRIIEFNTEDLYAVVQAGVITAALALEAEKHGLFYPPDPASMKVSTIGGNVAENAGGLRGLKYGVTKDYLMGVRFYDVEGNLVIGGGKTVKQATGFNLPGLMVSSEGLLGVMVEFILRVIPKPESSKSLMVVYSDIIRACETVSEIIASRIFPATMEILDSFTIKAVREAVKSEFPAGADALLLIEIDGHPGVVNEEFDRILKICNSFNGVVRVANSESERDEVWEARRMALSSLARLRPTVILEDATVPRSKVPAMMKAIQEISRKHDITIGTFGHAGDGNLHPTIITDRRDRDEMRRVKMGIDDIFHAALKLDGTLTGEHGIGFLKAGYLEGELGAGTISFMKKLKQGVDSKNILNPHKMNL